MKQLILGLSLFLSVLNFSAAQDFENETIQEMRVNFYNENLQFTDAEKQSFWPLFNQFKKDEKALKKQFKPDQKFELMSDAQAKEFILKSLDQEDKLLDLKRQYIIKMMEVIPVRKVAMLNRVERQFKRSLLNDVKNKRREFDSN